MIVTVNALELASDLAGQRLTEEWGDLYPHEHVSMLDGENYTEEAQDIFNEHYEFYFKMITNLHDDG